MTEQDNVVLQFDVGAPSTAATATEAAATSAAAEATSSTGKCRRRRRHARRSSDRRRAGPCSPCLPGRGPIAQRQPCPTTHSWPRRDRLRDLRARRCRRDWQPWRDLRRRLWRDPPPAVTTFGTIRRARPIAATIPDTIATAVPCPIAARSPPIASAGPDPVPDEAPAARHGRGNPSGWRRRPSGCCCRSAAER